VVFSARMQLDLRATLAGIVRAGSIDDLARAVTASLAASRSVALARAWVVDGSGALQLVGSAGTPSGGGSYSRMDGEFREMAIADAKIAEVAASREAFVVLGLRGDEEWLTNPLWAARQGVRAFVALPLIEQDALAGVLAIVDRVVPSPEAIAELQLVADLSAVRVTELRARSTELSERLTPATIVFTRAELRRVERQNIESALAQTRGKVFGVDGAAALLGMRPTTLASRIKALGIAHYR
jgi:transcriptional regulator with GAF, ATPase, and Fis domain